MTFAAFCPDHFVKLRERISDYGLLDLAAKDEDDLRFILALGERDPLMFAYQALMMSSLMKFGYSMFEQGYFCPMDFVSDNLGEGMVDALIEAAVKNEAKQANSD